MRAAYLAARVPTLSEIPSPREAGTVRVVPASPTWDDLSKAFRMHWVSDDAGVVLIRRPVTPDESLEFELEELTLISRRLASHARTMCPYPSDIRATHDQETFFASLSQEQLGVMKTRGLSYSQLELEQQGLWSKINLVKGYANTRLELERTAELLGNWERATVHVAAQDHAPSGLAIHLAYPNSFSPEGSSRVDLTGSLAPGSRQLKNPGAGQRIQLPVSNLSSRFNARLRLEDGVATTVGEVIAAVNSAARTRVQTPVYARDRKVIALLDDAPAATALAMLQRLYAWTIMWDGKRWVLGIPQFSAPKSADDFHSKVRQTLPPAVLLELDPGLDAQDRRHTRLRGAVLDVATVASSRGQLPGKLLLKELPHPLQMRLANELFLQQLFGALIGISRPQPFAWLRTPAAGFFTLQGEGKHPRLMFRVRTSETKSESWGWIVGTSSLAR